MNHHPQQYMIFANEIHQACKGAGTDELRILNVLTQCSMEDLQQVFRAYYVSFGQPISRLLKKETGGKFRDIVLGSFEGRYQYWARKIREAIKGISTDEKSLIELVLMGNADDWLSIREEYFKAYTRNVMDDISDDIAKNADWSKLLRGWIFQMRYFRSQPERDAEELYSAVKGAGTDADTFVRILCSTTHEEFAQIVRIYQEKYNRSLRETITKEFTGKSEKAFLLAHDYMLSPAKGCSYIINESFKGFGSCDKSLVDTTVLFRDRYSAEVQHAYEDFGNLAKDIKKDTSKKYEKALLLLWKAQ
ncbi:Annexin_2 [Hexamita inflata]|uniref:Annexin 2 n=1 Tax=Hexamita inflata TaxID=28002 RepID=A0AA86N6K4_9EUKA|nr:Annexin 2 [Hexamita inflata]